MLGGLALQGMAEDGLEGIEGAVQSCKMSPGAVRLSIEHHGCQRWIASLDFTAPTHWPLHVSAT